MNTPHKETPPEDKTDGAKGKQYQQQVSKSPGGSKEKTLAERLMVLFAGNQQIHGTHGEPVWDEGKSKWNIRATALQVHRAATLADWQQHVAGTRPLGIAPTMAGNPCMCWWGCGDIDEYDLEIGPLIALIEQLKYPLVPVRSKSGGLHLFLFLTAPEPAAAVQAVIKAMMASIGHAKAEVFPKQTKLVAGRDQPNWIIMPYFGGDFDGKLAMQRGLRSFEGELTLPEFLRAAEAARTTTADVRVARGNGPNKKASGNGKDSKVPFGDGPPCLEHLAAAKVRTGGNQNDALVAMGTYYKKAFPESWKEKLAFANQAYLDPVGSNEGLQSVTRSLEKKDYFYRCKTEPLCSH